MKKIINFFIFFLGLIILVFYTLFYVQNRVLVPIRLTFGQPALCLLPLIVLVSIAIGVILCSIFILSCRLSKSSSGKTDTVPSKKETDSVKEDSAKLLDNSAIPNKTGGLAETHNSCGTVPDRPIRLCRQNPRIFDSKENYRIKYEDPNLNNDSFYDEYEKCKRKTNDLFKSIQSKAQLRG